MSWIRCKGGDLLNMEDVVTFEVFVHLNVFDGKTYPDWRLIARLRHPITGAPDDGQTVIVSQFGRDEEQATTALYQLSRQLPGQMLDADLDFNGEAGEKGVIFDAHA